MSQTDQPKLKAAADHLSQAAQQLRRFGDLGFSSFSEPAANEVEKLANVLREWKPGESK